MPGVGARRWRLPADLSFLQPHGVAPETRLLAAGPQHLPAPGGAGRLRPRLLRLRLPPGTPRRHPPPGKRHRIPESPRPDRLPANLERRKGGAGKRGEIRKINSGGSDRGGLEEPFSEGGREGEVGLGRWSEGEERAESADPESERPEERPRPARPSRCSTGTSDTAHRAAPPGARKRPRENVRRKGNPTGEGKEGSLPGIAAPTAPGEQNRGEDPDPCLLAQW